MGFNAKNVLISALSCVVFLILNLFDYILRLVFGLLDRLLGGQNKSSPLQRKSMSTWSDCGCDSCIEWTKNDNKLHVSILEPTQGNFLEDGREKSVENIVFIHGMFSSSSAWTKSVFPNLSESIKQSHRFFAIDLLGFGRSPKPMSCSYTLDENIEMIEQSVIRQFHLESFHLVAHSMGCMIAIALAAKHLKCVKSITLVAPPFFLGGDSESEQVRETIATKRLWPPSLFIFSIVGRYESISRFIFIIFLRNHRTWEELSKKLCRISKLSFEIPDIARYSHYSYWHTMSNLVCGGSKFMEMYLKVLSEAQVKICAVHGDQDPVVPVECSNKIKIVAPNAEVDVIKNGGHSSIIHGRIKEFTTYVERIWASCS